MLGELGARHQATCQAQWNYIHATVGGSIGSAGSPNRRRGESPSASRQRVQTPSVEAVVGFDFGTSSTEHPVPRNLDAPGIGQKDFSFLAVAYGLSLPVYQIGVIRPPSAADDIDRYRQRPAASAIDKDTV